MRAVSGRCQLKSLRDERWRRPLSHRRRAEGGPRPPNTPRWGGVAVPRKSCRARFPISSVRQVLRPRCDARGFRPLPIEIIARRKVAPAFEPQKASGRGAPPPEYTTVGGGGGPPEILSGPIPHFKRQTSVATSLRCARFQAAAN